MNIDLQQLEQNVNLHALQPGFLNRELHYVIASDAQHFRFVETGEEPGDGEQKFYCYLTDRELKIPAGQLTLQKSYAIAENPPYAILQAAEDFFPFIDCIGENCASKAIRGFSQNETGNIASALRARYGSADKHLITSPEFEHMLLILPQAEISISATMVYFKQRIPVTSAHYQHLEEEKTA